jgi:hypothetical protein
MIPRTKNHFAGWRVAIHTASTANHSGEERRACINQRVQEINSALFYLAF